MRNLLSSVLLLSLLISGCSSIAEGVGSGVRGVRDGFKKGYNPPTQQAAEKHES